MSDTSPFMIRLELLKLAQSILEQQCYAKQDQLRMDWDSAKDKTAFPELPTVTAQAVIATAESLNEFVSRK